MGGIAKAAALADSRFSKTVKDINAARKEASAQVLGARKDFATKLNSLTSKIKAMETKLVGEVMVVSGDVINNRAIQARVNAANAAEMNRIEKLMNLQHSESIKARGKLRRVLDENKRAAAEETDELDTLFKGKIAKIRSVMAANARDAAKDLTKATTQMYTNMANVQQANLEKNAAHKAAIEKYATESQAAIAASKKDFSSRLQALTTVVAANHNKVKKGLTVLPASSVTRRRWPLRTARSSVSRTRRWAMICKRRLCRLSSSVRQRLRPLLPRLARTSTPPPSRCSSRSPTPSKSTPIWLSRPSRATTRRSLTTTCRSRPTL